MKYFAVLLLIFTSSCVKQKSILICGDHKCVNKEEAKQYFEENLTIEIQIISKSKKTSFDLVDLNLGKEESSLKIYENKKNKVIKKLSKKEIKDKKKQLKKKKKEENKIVKKDTNKKKITKQRDDIKFSSTYRVTGSQIDICLKVKKCDIDSIANYLIKSSKEKNYPNIAAND